MLEWVKVLTNTLGVDPSVQGTVLVMVVCILIFWSIYSNTQKQAKEEQERLRTAFTVLYAPALGLLKGYHSGRLPQETFQERFTDLLIKERAKGATHVFEAMEAWLQGVRNEDELEYLLIEACRDAGSRLRDTRTLSVVDAAFWLMDEYLNVGRAAVALVLVLIFGAAFAYLIMNLSNGGRIWVVLTVTLLIVSIKRHRTRRRQRELATGIEDIRRRRKKEQATG